MRNTVLAFVLLAAPAFAQKTAYTPPRTPDGQPDIGGVWTNATITPLERPADLTDKQFFTKEEAAAYEQKTAQQSNRDRRDGPAEADVTRAYNEAWFDRGTKVSRTLRTSLISDPVDGKVPAMTADAQQKWAKIQADFAAHPGDGPEDRPLPDRCLMFSQVGPPMMAGNYNDNYQIVQTRDFVSFRAEMGGIVRVVPLDGRPHLPSSVRSWMSASSPRSRQPRTAAASPFHAPIISSATRSRTRRH